jgi:hypothetical protein
MDKSAKGLRHGVALGRRSTMFASLLRGAEPAAMFFSLIQTCRLDYINARIYLANKPRTPRFVFFLIPMDTTFPNR